MWTSFQLRNIALHFLRLDLPSSTEVTMKTNKWNSPIDIPTQRDIFISNYWNKLSIRMQLKLINDKLEVKLNQLTMFFHKANAAAAWPRAEKCRQSKPKNDLAKLLSYRENKPMSALILSTT